MPERLMIKSENFRVAKIKNSIIFKIANLLYINVSKETSQNIPTCAKSMPCASINAIVNPESCSSSTGSFILGILGPIIVTISTVISSGDFAARRRRKYYLLYDADAEPKIRVQLMKIYENGKLVISTPIYENMAIVLN